LGLKPACSQSLSMVIAINAICKLGHYSPQTGAASRKEIG
jgi:hypothetical protein